MKNKTAVTAMKKLIKRFGLGTVADQLGISPRYTEMIRDGKAPSKRLYVAINELAEKKQ